MSKCKNCVKHRNANTTASTTSNPVCENRSGNTSSVAYHKQDQIVVCDCCIAKTKTVVDQQQQQHHSENSDLGHVEANNVQPPDTFAYREANRKFSNLVSRIL